MVVLGDGAVSYYPGTPVVFSRVGGQGRVDLIEKEF